MIYLIDHVLPESYFDNNLRALSVDMAVFRDLLKLTLPTLSKHLDHLQHAAQDVSTGLLVLSTSPGCTITVKMFLSGFLLKEMNVCYLQTRCLAAMKL